MQTAIKLVGLTKKEIADDLGISVIRLRQIIKSLKSLPEFGYRSHDKLISMNDYQIILNFWSLAKSKTFNHALEHFRKFGVSNEH